MSIEPVSETAAPSARPQTSAPTTTLTRVAPGAKPRTKGDAISAIPTSNSTAPWAGSEMSRKAVIAPDSLLVDRAIECEERHSRARGLRFCADDHEGPPGRPPRRAGPVRLPQPGRRVGHGGRGAPGR